MSGNSVKVYIDRFPILDITRFEWHIAEGTSPYSTTFPLRKQEALELIQIQKEFIASSLEKPYLTLRMTDHRDVDLVFRNIYVLPPEPHPDPRFLTMTIVDSRYFWNRVHFTHDYNMKTKIGDRAVQANIEELGGLISVPVTTFDKWAYKSYSLNPPNLPSGGEADDVETALAQIFPKLWSLSEVILHILNYYKSFPDMPTIEIATDDEALAAFDSIFIEDISIDTNIASALNHVLQYAGGLGIFVDNLGIVRFFNRIYGEDELLSKMGISQEPNEYHILARGALSSPRWIDVLFTKEIEVRFDFIEDEEVEDPELNVDTQKRLLHNVMPCPDAALTLPNGSVAVGGQYVRFPEIIPAFKTEDFVVGGETIKGVSVSFADIRLNWPIADAWLAGPAGIHKSEPKFLWMNRINCIKQNYRQTYQINKHWLDKMIGIMPRRVSIIDYATGTYTPSPVYQNYAVLLTTRGIIAPDVMLDKSTWDYWFSVKEFAASGKINESKICDVALLTFADIDRGIFKVNFRIDPLQHYAQVFPSAVDGIPVYLAGFKLHAKFTDEAGLDGKKLTLSPTHRMATIITASPAPNIEGDLFKVRIYPVDLIAGDGSEIIPGLQKKIENSLGPPIQIRAPKSNITARVTWSDAPAAVSAIEASFGIGPGNPDGIFPYITNYDQVEKIARRMAAVEWVKYQDRFKGGKEGFFKMLYPKGTISRIVFRVESNGRSSTVLKTDGSVTTPNFINLLPAPLRAFFNKQVDSKG